MDESVPVVGGSVGALVTADALRAAGRPVRLYLPKRAVGSGFLPVTAGGRSLELGPRIVELAYDEPVGVAPDLADYEPGPHGHRPYLALIEQFVRELAGDDLVPVRRPELVVDGRRTDDFLMGGDLATLPVLAPGDVDVIAEEAAECVAREGDAGLLAPEREAELWEVSFAEASRRNHGDRFHDRFIDAVAGKILEGGAGSVVAALRRKIWLPLFHPRTVHDACTGRLTYRPDRPMHTVVGGGMGAIVARLLARVRAASLVEVVEVDRLGSLRRDGDGLVLKFDGGPTVGVTGAVIGTSAEEAFAAAGVDYRPARVPLSIAWLDAAADDVVDPPSALFVTDADIPVFRVSESTADAVPGRVTLTCELDHRADGERLGERAVEAVERLGLVRPGATVEVLRTGTVPAFTIPSFDEQARFVAARAAFDALALSVTLVGGGPAFLADSFNEQVVQGLRAAQLADS